MDREAGPRPGRGGEARVVGPPTPAGDEGVGTLGEGGADEELEVPQLVPAERERQQVLALDPDLRAGAECLAEPWQRLERRRAIDEREARRGCHRARW